MNEKSIIPALFHLPDHEIEYNLINNRVRKSSLIACRTGLTLFRQMVDLGHDFWIEQEGKGLDPVDSYTEYTITINIRSYYFKPYN